MVSEEAIAALLLEMDKEPAEEQQVAHGKWRLASSIFTPEGDPAKIPGTGSPEALSEKPPLSPAEVAAAILSKKSFAWLRPKASNSADSKESAAR
jgi:hypothetical protein